MIPKILKNFNYNFVYSKKYIIFGETKSMKIFAVKNGIRYFKERLSSTDNKERKIYYRNEIYRLEEKLYNLEFKEEDEKYYDKIIQERERTD